VTVLNIKKKIAENAVPLNYGQPNVIFNLKMRKVIKECQPWKEILLKIRGIQANF